MNYSKQRDEITKYLKSVYSHPSAETIYENVKLKIPNISLGTVYRNLDTLVSLGEIKRIRLSGASDRFDGDTSSHYHAICTVCGRVDDIHLKDELVLDKKVEQLLNCKILSHEIIFHTICPYCK